MIPMKPILLTALALVTMFGTFRVSRAEDLTEEQFRDLLISKSPWRAEWQENYYGILSSGTYDLVFRKDGKNLKGKIENHIFVVPPQPQHAVSGNGDVHFLEVLRKEKSGTVKYKVSYRASNGADTELDYERGVLSGSRTAKSGGSGKLTLKPIR